MNRVIICKILQKSEISKIKIPKIKLQCNQILYININKAYRKFKYNEHKNKNDKKMFYLFL